MITLNFSKGNFDLWNNQLSQIEDKHLQVELISILKNVQNSNSDTFYTSGTTGDKKEYTFTQEQIRTSCNNTLNFFDLQPGAVLVSPLLLEFVAGKMNIYRAIYGRLNLIFISPKNICNSIPNQKIDFITLVPNQISQLIKCNFNFNLITKILVGGGEFGGDFDKEKYKTLTIYNSFSMTETLTHFGIKQVFPEKENNFKLLNGFQINNQKGTLSVTHPIICPKEIITNELVEIIDSNLFKWIGRNNNMIKCGGLKIYPELIEQKLKKIIDSPFVIVGINDNTFGEIPVLVIEGKAKTKEEELTLSKLMISKLDKYEVPKKIFYLVNFTYTDSGKIKRNIIKENLK